MIDARLFLGDLFIHLVNLLFWLGLRKDNTNETEQ
jgi:hypothetical protein